MPGRWWAAVLYPDAEPIATFPVDEATTRLPEVKFN